LLPPVPKPPPNTNLIDAFRRLLATGCAALVFALGLLSANPALHALAHGKPAVTAHADCTHRHADTPPNDDGSHTCAVVLFAHGFTLTLQTVAPAALSVGWHDVIFPAVEEQFLTAPRYLHQPERGPPLV
jgi:hypothetical protein